MGDYDCSCQPEWRGKNCDISDRASPGGVDKSNGRYEIIDLYEEKQKCIEYECERKAGDNRCDEECNTHACNYDGLDCRLGINPWKYCNATVSIRGGKSCWEVFEDGRCDEACNTKECLFDGRDCEAGTKLECNPNYDVYCSDHFGNGHCDMACNNAACGWDGLDCEPVSEQHEIIPGSFYVVLTMTIPQFDQAMQKRFERYLSLTLRTSFKIRRNPDGSAMVFDFNPASSVPAELPEGDKSGYAFNTNLVLQGNMGIIVYLEVDNVKCQQESADYCYHDAEGYANLFSAMIGTGKLKDEWGILQVGASEEDEDGSNGPSIGGIAVGVVLLIGMIFVVNMMVNKKKRARGIQWFPENFTLTGGSSGLHGGGRKRQANADHQQQEMLGFGSGSSVSSKRYASNLDIERWSDDDPLEQASKRRRQDYCSSSDRQTIISNDYENDSSDSRTWTQQHINAADIRNPEILACALTPPQGEVLHNEMMTNDVNGRGPMGMTPLMIASFRGTGVDNGDIENFESNPNDLEDSSPAVIQDLISQGAKLNAQMDKTGETPLHLAARYARADAAKRLLDAGDDAIANAQDNTGRTPLHAAVAADAQGVFHILLKNRYTNLDAKAFDGTSPLMLAVRMAIEGVPEALMEAGADVNIADENGKTALHWAAAVNNVDAVNTLLKNNANRDAQDHKDETPLFLAAREGSFQAAKALLDHGANREIQDHMDRLPLTVAQERRCSQVHGMAEDIVNLLETYPSPSQMPGGSMHPFSSQPMLSGGSPPGLMMQSKNHHSSSMHRMKKQAVKKTSNGLVTSLHHDVTDSNSVLSSCTLPRSGAGQQARNQSQRTVKQTISKAAQVKKTDSSSMLMLSPEHSPYEQSQGSFVSSGAAQHLALSHPNLEDLVSKQPPSYEAALAGNHHSLQGGMPGQQSLEGQYYQGQQQQIHNRQQSMPASVSSTYSNHLSPPHSNLSSISHHNGQSPSHSTGVMSPPNAAVMSPPQSVTMSPPQSTMQNSVSPPLLQQQQLQHHSSSPIKSRSTQLPTSPTHMAAMRGATHQRQYSHQASSFDFDHQAQNQQQQQQMYMNRQQFLYPTPPQEQGGHNNSFLSPSPDSPDQWSSASPQSHSDWSEGIHSPPSVMNGHFGQHHSQHLQQPQQMINQQTTDAVII